MQVFDSRKELRRFRIFIFFLFTPVCTITHTATLRKGAIFFSSFILWYSLSCILLATNVYYVCGYNKRSNISPVAFRLPLYIMNNSFQTSFFQCIISIKSVFKCKLCETSLIANCTEPCVVVLNTCIMKGQAVADFTPLDKTSGSIGVVWVLTF